MTCPDDEETTVPVKIYIDEIEVSKDENHNRDIDLDGKLTFENEVSITQRVYQK